MRRLLPALLLLALPAAASCQGGKEMPSLAASYPGGVRTLDSVTYREVDGEKLALDLYLPPERKPRRPAVLFVHGGGFIQGHRRMMGAASDFPARLAALAAKGYVVASMEYRLLPKAFFPAQIQDAKAAVAWLRDHAGDYGIDPDRVAIWGSSAGGTIASTLALSCGDLAEKAGEGEDGGCVQAAADWFGPASIEAGSLSMAYLGCTGETNCGADRLRAASPVARVFPGAPPFQIMHGDHDAIVPLAQSQQFDAALRAAGNDVELRIVKDAGHGLRARDAAQQSRILGEAMAALTAFLDRTIGDSALSAHVSEAGKEEK